MLKKFEHEAIFGALFLFSSAAPCYRLSNGGGGSYFFT